MKSKILWIVAAILLVLTIVLMFVPAPEMLEERRATLTLFMPWAAITLILWARCENLTDACKEIINYSQGTRRKADEAHAKLFLHEQDPKPHDDSDLARVDELYGFTVGYVDDDFIMNRQSIKLLRRKRKIRSDIPAKVRQEAREALQKDGFKRSREWFCNLEDDLK